MTGGAFTPEFREFGGYRTAAFDSVPPVTTTVHPMQAANWGFSATTGTVLDVFLPVMGYLRDPLGLVFRIWNIGSGGGFDPIAIKESQHGDTIVSALATGSVALLFCVRKAPIAEASGTKVWHAWTKTALPSVMLST